MVTHSALIGCVADWCPGGEKKDSKQAADTLLECRKFRGKRCLKEKFDGHDRYDKEEKEQKKMNE